jgi:hypothetical protein
MMATKLLDETLFTKLSQHTVSYLARLAPDNADSVERALKAGSTPPSFAYEKVHTLDIDARLTRLAEFEDTVAAHDEPGLQTLYLAKCKEIRNILYLLRAVQAGADRRFHHYSVVDSGAMDDFALQATRVRLDQLIDETHDDRRLAVAQARVRLCFNAGYSNSGQTVLEFLKAHQVHLPALVDVSGEQPLRAAEVREHFESYLTEHDITGYTVDIDKSGEERNLKVKKKSKSVVIPNDARLQRGRRRPITITTVKAFAEHELGVHVQRGFNGYQRLNLLGYGLTGYLNVEECIASYRQAQVEGIDDLQKFEHRLASMAIEGTLTGTPMAMAEAYRILYDAVLLREALEQPGTIDLDRVHELTWTPLLRVCRGTTGLTPGTCYTKDSRVYSNRFPEVYRLMQDEKWAQRAMQGKYDPRKPEHIKPLQQLAVL